nr:uncharacterized protein LOC111426974 [Onthophagus taurus]
MFNYSIGMFADSEKIKLSYEIFSTIICFVGIWTNYVIIRTILKNKSMRTPTNSYISNWAIYDLLYLIFVPVNFLLEATVEGDEVICVFKDIEGNLEFATILLITIFLFDYFISSNYRKFLTASWMLIVVISIASIINCTVGDPHINFPEIMSSVGYGILFVVFIGKLISYNLNSEQQNDSNYRLRLAVAFTYVFSWIFKWFFLYIAYGSENKLYGLLSWHANIIGFTNSIFNVFVLTLLNKQFYTNLFKMLHCRAELALPSDNDRGTQLNQ